MKHTTFDFEMLHIFLILKIFTTLSFFQVAHWVFSEGNVAYFLMDYENIQHFIDQTNLTTVFLDVRQF